MCIKEPGDGFVANIIQKLFYVNRYYDKFLFPRLEKENWIMIGTLISPILLE